MCYLCRKWIKGVPVRMFLDGCFRNVHQHCYDRVKGTVDRGQGYPKEGR